MADQMEFPRTFEEFVEDYGLVDTKEIYTNGIQLIPTYRVRQWLGHKTCDVKESNFSIEQYRADIDAAYDCGYMKASQEYKEKIDKVLAEIEELEEKDRKANNPWGDAWGYVNPYSEVLKILKEM